MFSNSFRDFEEDPFFSPFRDRHEHMSRMMRDIGSFGFRDPFDRHAAIEGPREHDRRERGHRERAGMERRRPHRDDLGHDYRDRELVPNDMFSSMFTGMRSMMNQMERNFERMGSDPNSYSYHQSSVMSYSNTGDGDPKYYQATTSTKRAPDGIKETKRAVRDSESGVHKMAIGHHIGDRGYVMERSMDKNTGREERHENFLNMNESEKSTFEKEWRDKAAMKRRRLHDEYKPSHYLGDERPHKPKAHQRRVALPEAPPRQTTKRDWDLERKRDHLKTRATPRPSNKHAPKEDL